jgi:hypothetical protein
LAICIALTALAPTYIGPQSSNRRRPSEEKIASVISKIRDGVANTEQAAALFAVSVKLIEPGTNSGFMLVVETKDGSWRTNERT